MDVTNLNRAAVWVDPTEARYSEGLSAGLVDNCEKEGVVAQARCFYPLSKITERPERTIWQVSPVATLGVERICGEE